MFITDRTSNSLWHRIQTYLEHTMVHSDFAFPYIASIGCKILHHRHIEEPISYMAGIPERSLLLHILNVAPSGTGKSYLLELFHRPDIGILPQNIFPSVAVGKITEAGLVGGYNSDGSKSSIGYAEKYSDGFLIVHEFSIILDTSGSDHSSELVNQLLQIMSECHVNKKLGNKEFDIETNVCIWASIQPSRFLNFTAGLGRRFLLLARAWSDADLDLMKDVHSKWRLERVDKRDIGYLKDLRKSIHEDLISLKKNVNEIESVEFDVRVEKCIQQYSANVSEMQILERFAMGYALMTSDPVDYKSSHVLTVRHSLELEAYLLRIQECRDLVNRGNDIYMLQTFLKTHGGICDLKTLWNYFLRFGYNYVAFMDLLDDCVKYRIVTVDTQANNRYVKLRLPM